MRIHKLLMPAVTLAGALALAGCGGGSSTPGGPPSPQPTEVKLAKGGYFGDDTNRYTCNADDGCEYTINADGVVQETNAQLVTAGFLITQPEEPRTCGAGTVAGANNTCVPAKRPQTESINLAVGESEKASAAAAGFSAAAIKSFGQWSAVGSQGDSSAVKTAAETVRDAPQKIGAEITKSEAERAKLKALLDALPATATAADKAPIEAGIARIDEDLEGMGRLVRPGSALVRNAARVPASGPNSPERRALAVARTVSGYIAATDTYASLGVGAGPIPTVAVGKGNNRSADMKTFAEIFGADNTSQVAFGEANQQRIAYSLNGETYDGFVTNAGGTQSFSDFSASDAYAGVGFAVTHAGITGNIIQRGSGAAEAPTSATGAFGAGWYFVPNPAGDYNANARWVIGNDGNYDQAVWVEYGAWLTGSADAYSVRLTNGSATAPTDANRYVLNANTDLDDGTATYRGSALGISARENTSTGTVTGSGGFDATVEMTARFGTAPSLDGKIHDFKGNEDAVDPSWELEWKNATLPLSSGAVTHSWERPSGTVVGRLRAVPYGTDAADRPAGFHGGFFHNFVNGRVAGVFATSKEDASE